MEKFSLKWKDFHTHVSQSFEQFRSESYLHDVTLMSEDYYEVSAHKLVLSASSEHFRNIFKKSKGSNTLICLNVGNRKELQNVIDYIYYGEVKIEQEKLDDFLQVAKKLKLDGVTNYKHAKEDAASSNHQEEKSPQSKSESEKPKDQRKVALNPDNTNIAAAEKEKDDVVNLNLSCPNPEIAMYVKKAKDGQFKCKICGKAVKVRGDLMKRHVDACLSDKPFYNCPICDETFRSKSGLCRHKTIVH